jgi:hypothetical protein
MCTPRSALPILLAAGLAATLVAPCVAQTELFLAEYQFNAARVAAMGLDGSNPRGLFDLPPEQWLPLGISYDATTQKFTWMDSAGASEIFTANLDGSKNTLLTGVSGFARGVGRDSQGRIYFSSDNTVQRVDADGSNNSTIYTSPTADPVGTCEVDATNNHVYVGAINSIIRMDLDGTNSKTVVVGISQPRAIALNIDAGHIYWLDADTISDYVGRANLDGTGFTVLIDHTPSEVSGSTSLIDIMVDPVGQKLYYAEEIAAAVYSANLDGSNRQLIYTSPAGKSPAGFSLSTGDPVQALQDCNNNGVNDDVDIAAGAPDCDNNGVIDTCQTNPCPQRVVLLDQGDNPADFSGRALGVPSEWQIFQPFEVPAKGWTVGEIAIDGHNTNYADGSGITLRIYPDNGAGLPDESGDAIASAVFNLRFGTNFENWVYIPVSATLTEGTYWVQLEANNPTVFGASINHGFGGLPSRSRGSSGNFTGPANPIALQIFQGSDTCAADFNTDGVVNSQDFFDFLNAFFKGNPIADFNNDDVINSQDFFDFLNTFFAGC